MSAVWALLGLVATVGLILTDKRTKYGQCHACHEPYYGTYAGYWWWAALHRCREDS